VILQHKSKNFQYIPKDFFKLVLIKYFFLMWRNYQTWSMDVWISTMVKTNYLITKKDSSGHNLFKLQCMMGAMNEFWLVAPRMHCNMLYYCHHCWDSHAESWCLCVLIKKSKSIDTKYYSYVLVYIWPKHYLKWENILKTFFEHFFKTLTQ